MKSYFMAGDYRDAIRPAYIRKAATGLQCLVFEVSLNPVSLLPMTAEPALSQKEINLATNKFMFSYSNMFPISIFNK